MQEEYDQEGIAWAHIEFRDNAPVLAFIDGRMGVLDVLNEECVRPSGNDEGFVNKLESLHKAHAAFARKKTSRIHFTVRHYARCTRRG